MRETGAPQDEIAGLLLAWYDGAARDLPWRVPPQESRAGVKGDPYRIWLSEVMLQQTTVAAVKDYFNRFTRLWPTVADLAAAEDSAVMAQWAGLGYYARARNLLACARVVAHEHGGNFPSSLKGLLALPGVGPYTAAAIASIAFHRSEVVVDGNVERVMARLHALREPLPAAKAAIYALAAEHTPQSRAGDYAQALMDLGATICTPRSPSCLLCPLQNRCMAKALGIASELPMRAPKALKPQRRGKLWLVERPSDGALLLEDRPPKGLLGGMLGFVGDAWELSELQARKQGAGLNAAEPPLTANWQSLGEISHVFTHFQLTLEVFLARSEGNPMRGSFIPPTQFRADALPGLMRKAYDLAEPHLHGLK